MQVTAEIRWFWNSSHDELEKWFRRSEAHDCPPGGGIARIDSYLWDSHQVELGIKLRGGKKGVEIKGLVSRNQANCDAGPFGGPIELWSKWTSETLTLDLSKTVTTEKRRWMRKFDTTGDKPVEIELNEKELPADRDSLPSRGCGIELTEIRFLDHETKEVIPESKGWWTLSLESFGKLDSIEGSLCQVAELMASRKPPNFDNSHRASYPSFLSKHAPQSALSDSHRV